jgi:hypothetical protein
MADNPAPDVFAVLTAELLSLRKQHLEAIADATFLGWTPEAQATQNKRTARMAALIARLDELNRTPEVLLRAALGRQHGET